MEGLVRNSGTGFAVNKYLMRCKWDEKQKKITNYGDNVKATTTFEIVGEAYTRATSGHHYIYIPKSEYKKDYTWDTAHVTEAELQNVGANFDVIKTYSYYTYSSKNEDLFNSKVDDMKYNVTKIIKAKEIDFYVIGSVTDDELADALTLADYVTNDINVGSDETWNKLIEYSKTLGMFHEEIIK